MHWKTDRAAKWLRPIGADFKESDRRGQNKNYWVKRLHHGSGSKDYTMGPGQKGKEVT